MSQMYEWVNGSKKNPNPLAGECPHDCVYCWVKDLKKIFPSMRNKYAGELRLVEKELKRSPGKGTLFVCSCNDLFAEKVPDEFIIRILNWLNKYPEPTYLLQSKNPDRFTYFKSMYPPNTILCTTIESDSYEASTVSNAPSPEKRAIEFDWRFRRDIKRAVTIEPIMDFTVDGLATLISMVNPDFVNIGADSKKHGLPEPSKEKTLKLIKKLEIITEVRLKHNLKKIIGDIE